MFILLAADNQRATAALLQQKAFDYINPVVNPGPPEVRQYPGTTSWSPIWTDNAQPTPRYGITYEASIAGAFTDEELGAIRDGEGNLVGTTNIVEGEQYTVPRRGAPYGEWHISTE